MKKLTLENAIRNMRPKGTGKKKIEIKKIQDRRTLAVTFSKRRPGLFTKAGELNITTGAQIGIVVQSPAGRFYTHASGAPSVDSIIDRFLQKTSSSCDHENNIVGQPQNTMMITPGTPIVEKEEEKDQDQDLKAWKYWLDLDVESLNSEEEITMLMGKLEKLQNKVGSIMMARDKEFIDSILFV